jgi:hypothetical protein
MVRHHTNEKRRIVSGFGFPYRIRRRSDLNGILMETGPAGIKVRSGAAWILRPAIWYVCVSKIMFPQVFSRHCGSVFINPPRKYRLGTQMVSIMPGAYRGKGFNAKQSRKKADASRQLRRYRQVRQE